MLVQQNIIVKNADIIGQRGVKPMTPDEVVTNLEANIEHHNCRNDDQSSCAYCQNTISAISLLQDYQKLREKIDVDELSFLIYKYETGLGEELARANWTAKHFQDKSKINSTPLAQSIVTYLQQPTEH